MKIILQFIITTLLFVWNANLVAQTNLVPTNNVVVTKEITEFKDQILVINIWNSKKQNIKDVQKLNALVEKYKNKQVRFLAIQDYETLVNNNIKYGIAFKYQHYTGIHANKIFDRFQTGMYKVYPIHIIINQKGKVVFNKHKYSKNIDKKISKKLNALLK